MLRISIELTPGDPDSLRQELAYIQSSFPNVDTINIPDILRLPIRSWEGCAAAKPYFSEAIPHIRAIDFDLSKPFTLKRTLHDHAIREVLIVTGDPWKNNPNPEYGTTSIDLIRYLKRTMPQLRIYAAVDPYRSSLYDEREYVLRKLEAGADGFFTQPFFDLRFLELYQDILFEQDVFWGIAPVATERSRRYWENRNRVVFPPFFRTDLDWNIQFAGKVLEHIGQTGGNLYFMPIKIDLKAYLSGIFA